MKELAKRLARGAALATVSPLLASYWLVSRLSSPDASLESHSQVLSCLPGTLGSYLRVAFFRVTLEHCDPTATIAFGAVFSKTGVRLGRHCYVGPRCLLGLVTLEDDVLLGPGVQIPSGPMSHGIERLDVPIREQPGSPQRIKVGRDSWIGAGSIVLADVAEQTVAGAGSILTKTHPPRSILAGTPAKVVKQRAELTRPVAEVAETSDPSPFGP